MQAPQASEATAFEAAPERQAPLHVVPSTPSIPWGRSKAKRAMDVLLSAAAFLVLLPWMAIIAIAIRIDSPGPIVFRQRRVGLDRRGEDDDPRWTERRQEDLGGRPFAMYKFRTMRTDSAAYAPSPRNRDDPRVTRVGRFLRRTCLDELPQLVNVLRGDMSVVGPRPEMPFITVDYGDLERRRLQVRPGITGLWQIRGSRERAIHESIELDLAYLDSQSLKTDLRILAETFAFMSQRLNY